MRISTGIGVAFLAACLACKPSLAQSPEETSDFELVRKIDSRLGYATFLQAYPDGYYADQAKKLRDALPESKREKEDFELVDKSGTRRAYLAFIATYKSGHFVDLARERLSSPEGFRKPNWGDQIFIPKLTPGNR